MQPLRPCLDAAGLSGVALEQREVELAALERATQFDAHPARTSSRKPGRRAGKIRQQLGQPIGGEILRNAEPHHAVAGGSRDHVARFLGQRQDPPRIG